MTNQASEDELARQIESITQAMFVTLSEWQAGVSIDWHSAKVKGRADLLNLIRTEKLKLLAEVRERVVGENASKGTYMTYSNLTPVMQDFRTSICNDLKDDQRTALTKLEAEL